MFHLFWIVLLAIHLTAIAYWVGGAFSTMQMRRATKTLEPNIAATVQLQHYTRSFRALLHVVPLALISGFLLFFHAISHGAHLPWPYHIMVLCGVMMTALFILMWRGPFQKARRAMRPSPEDFKKLFRFNLGVMIWGIIAIFAGALGHG